MTDGAKTSLMDFQLSQGMEEQALGVFQSTQQTQTALQERAATLETVKAEYEQKKKEVSRQHMPIKLHRLHERGKCHSS